MSYQVFFFACIFLFTFVFGEEKCVPNLKGVEQKINEICPACTNMTVHNVKCLSCAPQEKSIPFLVVCDSIWSGKVKCEDTPLCQEYQCCENYVWLNELKKLNTTNESNKSLCSPIYPYCDVHEVQYPCCFYEWCTPLAEGFGICSQCTPNIPPPACPLNKIYILFNDSKFEP
jgi:hypothetical protein